MCLIGIISIGSRSRLLKKQTAAQRRLSSKTHALARIRKGPSYGELPLNIYVFMYLR
jgi:hypothetical protein